MFKCLYIAFVLGSFLWSINDESDNKEIYSEIKSWYKVSKNEPLTFYQSPSKESREKKLILQIILIRHGKPEINKNGWFGYKAAKNYVIAYDTVGVGKIDKLPVILEPHEEVKIFSSSLFRAYDTSLKIFNEKDTVYADSAFVEFQREIIPLPLILPIKGWTGISRFFWMIGLHSSTVASFQTEKSRAKSVSELLDKAAIENRKVILVAHGLLNKYIVRYLKKNGWDHSYDGGNDYLAVQVMSKIDH